MRDDDHLYRTGMRNEKGTPICGARKSTYPADRTPCQCTALYPNGRCRYHGGPSPSGMASPNYKTGRYSKVLPLNLRARYEEARDDPELLSLTNEITVLITRIQQLFARVETGESGSLWDQGYKAMQQYDDNMAAMRALAHLPDDHSEKLRTSRAIQENLNAVRNIFKRGVADYAAWNEIQLCIQQLRMLVESERRRETELDLSIKVDRVLVYTGALLEAIRAHTDRYVPEPARRDFLQAVQQDVRRLVDASSDPGRS